MFPIYSKTSKIRASVFRNTCLSEIMRDTLNSEVGPTSIITYALGAKTFLYLRDVTFAHQNLCLIDYVERP